MRALAASIVLAVPCLSQNVPPLVEAAREGDIDALRKATAGEDLEELRRWCRPTRSAHNDFQVKLVKLQGEFVWHHHDAEDELFLVVKGRLTMQLRSGDLVLDPGELVIVPHGVEHCPKAEEECWVLLLEPKTTLNTGNVVNERTVRELERL